jgi:hypothetical protein
MPMFKTTLPFVPTFVIVGLTFGLTAVTVPSVTLAALGKLRLNVTSPLLVEVETDGLILGLTTVVVPNASVGALGRPKLRIASLVLPAFVTLGFVAGLTVVVVPTVTDDARPSKLEASKELKLAICSL